MVPVRGKSLADSGLFPSTIITVWYERSLCIYLALEGVGSCSQTVLHDVLAVGSIALCLLCYFCLRTPSEREGRKAPTHAPLAPLAAVFQCCSRCCLAMRSMRAGTACLFLPLSLSLVARRAGKTRTPSVFSAGAGEWLATPLSAAHGCTPPTAGIARALQVGSACSDAHRLLSPGSSPHTRHFAAVAGIEAVRPR